MYKHPFDKYPKEVQDRAIQQAREKRERRGIKALKNALQAQQNKDVAPATT
jgi:hypothetical protein